MKAGNQSVQAIKLLTQVKLTLGEWDQAEKLAQQLKEVEGEEAVSEQVLGLVYQGREKPDESIDAFKRAHELAPDADQPVVALVQTLVRNNKIGEARQFLEKVVSENENNVTATLLLGQLSLLEKDIPTAVGYFKRVVQINPKLDVSYRNLGSIYIRQRKLDDAERILMDGLAQNPGNTVLSVNLASVYEFQQKFDEAINVYEELLQKNPDLIVAKNNLASILTDHREDQASYDRARQLASEFRRSEVPQFRDTYAWASVRAGVNLAEAVTILETIVKENGNVGIYHYHLGEALLRNSDFDNARIHLEKAIELEKTGSRTAAQASASLQLISQ
jgi:tetratricopeptide (TPR) repeat protein